MKTSAEIFDLLKTQFGDKVVQLVTGVPKEEIIEIAPDAVEDIFFFLRDTDGLAFDNLILLTGLDDANGKKEIVDGLNYLVGGTLSVVYHVESTSLKHKLVVKAVVPKDTPDVATLSYVYGCADWQEREAYDMIGIKFTNHPNLIRILMPYDWDAGYPLRKDYKNPEFYQGMKVPY